MELISAMNESPDKVLFEQAAAELAVAPSMVEKDWHATQVLANAIKALERIIYIVCPS